MSPPISPMSKVAQPHRTSSSDSATDGMRKRVCKACDRCRLKKSKCDGSHPCSRCKADNAICVFGERKKSQDKVYPKGYVEVLEQQQSQLVLGLQETYRRLLSAGAWPGLPLEETNGHPLTHDLLAALGLLENKQDGSGEVEPFEEDCQKLQSRLLAEGNGYMQQRRGSFSSDSDHSQHGHARPKLDIIPNASQTSSFKDSFAFSTPPTPNPQSPPPPSRHQRPSFQHRAQPSPLQQQTAPPLLHDPQLFQAEWAIPDMSTPEAIMRSKFAMQTPNIATSLHHIDNVFEQNAFDDGAPLSTGGYDSPLDTFAMLDYMPQLSGGAFGDGMQSLDFTASLDPMELDLAKFISVQT